MLRPQAPDELEINHVRKGKIVRLDVQATLRIYILECLKILNNPNIQIQQTYHKAFEKFRRKHQQTVGSTLKKEGRINRRKPTTAPVSILDIEPSSMMSICSHYTSLLKIFTLEWQKLKARAYQDHTAEGLIQLFRENTRQSLFDYAAKHNIQFDGNEVPLELM